MQITYRITCAYFALAACGGNGYARAGCHKEEQQESQAGNHWNRHIEVVEEEKLKEEVNEYIEDKNIEELADIKNDFVTVNKMFEKQVIINDKLKLDKQLKEIENKGYNEMLQRLQAQQIKLVHKYNNVFDTFLNISSIKKIYMKYSNLLIF